MSILTTAATTTSSTSSAADSVQAARDTEHSGVATLVAPSTIGGSLVGGASEAPASKSSSMAATIRSSGVQAKLTIGNPNDKFEREADEVAAQVTQPSANNRASGEAPPPAENAATNVQREPANKLVGQHQQVSYEYEVNDASKPFAAGVTPMLQAKVFDNIVSATDSPVVPMTAYSNRSRGPPLSSYTVQRSIGASATGFAADQGFEHQLSKSKGGGTPISDSTRNFMESRFGADFSGVRIHTGSTAQQMSSSISAKAFTHGNDIYFNKGQYQPNSKAGQTLLAHELTHTIQQGASKTASQANVRRKPIAQSVGYCQAQSRFSVQRACSACNQHAHSVGEEEPIRTIADIAPQVQLKCDACKEEEKRGPPPAGSIISRKPLAIGGYARGMIQRAEWFRGQGMGVPHNDLPNSSHDFGRGLYLTDRYSAALDYAMQRGGIESATGYQVLASETPNSAFGRMLDLSKYPEWKGQSQLFESIWRTGGTAQLAGGDFWQVFNEFLNRNNIKLADYDSVKGPELVRGGNQIVIRNESLARAWMQQATVELQSDKNFSQHNIYEKNAAERITEFRAFYESTNGAQSIYFGKGEVRQMQNPIVRAEHGVNHNHMRNEAQVRELYQARSRVQQAQMALEVMQLEVQNGGQRAAKTAASITALQAELTAQRTAVESRIENYWSRFRSAISGDNVQRIESFSELRGQLRAATEATRNSDIQVLHRSVETHARALSMVARVNINIVQLAEALRSNNLSELNRLKTQQSKLIEAISGHLIGEGVREHVRNAVRGTMAEWTPERIRNISIHFGNKVVARSMTMDYRTLLAESMQAQRRTEQILASGMHGGRPLTVGQTRVAKGLAVFELLRIVAEGASAVKGAYDAAEIREAGDRAAGSFDLLWWQNNGVTPQIELLERGSWSGWNIVGQEMANINKVKHASGETVKNAPAFDTVVITFATSTDYEKLVGKVINDSVTLGDWILVTRSSDSYNPWLKKFDGRWAIKLWNKKEETYSYRYLTNELSARIEAHQETMSRNQQTMLDAGILEQGASEVGVVEESAILGGDPEVYAFNGGGHRNFIDFGEVTPRVVILGWHASLSSPAPTNPNAAPPADAWLVKAADLPTWEVLSKHYWIEAQNTAPPSYKVFRNVGGLAVIDQSDVDQSAAAKAFGEERSNDLLERASAAEAEMLPAVQPKLERQPLETPLELEADRAAEAVANGATVQRQTYAVTSEFGTQNLRAPPAAQAAKVNAHEAVHRAQFRAYGSRPVGTKPQLEAEARKGEDGTATGVQYSAAPGMTLQYNGERVGPWFDSMIEWLQRDGQYDIYDVQWGDFDFDGEYVPDDNMMTWLIGSKYVYYDSNELQTPEGQSRTFMWQVWAENVLREVRSFEARHHILSYPEQKRTALPMPNDYELSVLLYHNYLPTLGLGAFGDQVDTQSDAFLTYWLGEIETLQFVPNGFDPERFEPSSDVYAFERERDAALTEFVETHVPDLMLMYILDEYTRSRMKPQDWLDTFDMAEFAPGLYESLTITFLERMESDSYFRELLVTANMKTLRYRSINKIYGRGLRTEEQIAEAVADLRTLSTDEVYALPEGNMALEIISDPGRFYKTMEPFSLLSFGFLQRVSPDMALPDAVMEYLSTSIMELEEAGISTELGWLLTFLGMFAEMLALLEQQKAEIEATLAEKIGLRFDEVSAAIAECVRVADEFIKGPWTNMLQEVAIERLTQNRDDFVLMLGDWDNQAEIMAGRLEAGAAQYQSWAAQLESGEVEYIEHDGQFVRPGGVRHLKRAAKLMEGTAERLRDPEKREGERAQIVEAIDGFDSVKSRIESGDIPLNQLGHKIRNEAMARLDLGPFPEFATYGSILRRDDVAQSNPFLSRAVIAWEFREDVDDELTRIGLFMLLMSVSIASLLVPGLAGLAIAALDIALSIGFGIAGVVDAYQALDVARLDADGQLGGMTVEQAEAAINHAWLGLGISAVMSIGPTAFSAYRAYRQTATVVPHSGPPAGGGSGPRVYEIPGPAPRPRTTPRPVEGPAPSAPAPAPTRIPDVDATPKPTAPRTPTKAESPAPRPHETPAAPATRPADHAEAPTPTPAPAASAGTPAPTIGNTPDFDGPIAGGTQFRDSAGARQASALGWEPAPTGYFWRSNPGGEPILVRSSGTNTKRAFNPATRTFDPVVGNAPRSTAHLPDVSSNFSFNEVTSGDRIYKSASGELGVPGQVQTHRSESAQRAVSGGTGDHAGHLIGNQFGPPGDARNLSRQNWVQNTGGGTFYDLEQSWATSLQSGSRIHAEVVDITRIGPGGVAEARPYQRIARWRETRPDGSVVTGELTFVNSSSARQRAAEGIAPGNAGAAGGNVIPGPWPGSSAPVQPKLEVGQPNNRFEKEADAAAEAVMGEGQAATVSQNAASAAGIQRRIWVDGKPFIPDEAFIEAKERQYGKGMRELLIKLHNYGDGPTYEFRDADLFEQELATRGSLMKQMPLTIENGCCGYPSKQEGDNLAPEFWDRVGFIHFRAKQHFPKGKQASDAVEAIFKPDAETRIECAAMTAAVQLKAMMDALGKEEFNKRFPGGQGLELSHSQYPTKNPFLFGPNFSDVIVPSADYLLPGDQVYFRNFLDFSKKHPQRLNPWQGLNAIYLGNKMFVGHGLGPATYSEIIVALTHAYNQPSTVPGYENQPDKDPNDLVTGKGDTGLIAAVKRPDVYEAAEPGAGRTGGTAFPLHESIDPSVYQKQRDFSPTTPTSEPIVTPQPKLEVGGARDRYEVEADRAADAVMGGITANEPIAVFDAATVQRIQRDSPAPDGPVTDQMVFLASGDWLTAETRSKVQTRAQVLFTAYQLTVSDSDFQSGTVQGEPYVGVNWRSEWGEQPSTWTSLEQLDALLFARFSARSWEAKGATAYDSEETEKALTEEEWRWVEEVMQTPEINAIFRNVEDIPPVIIHRVSHPVTNRGANGQTRGEHVAMADKVYKKNDKSINGMGEVVEMSDKERFKSTLIHELMHFIDNVSPKGKSDTQGLMAALVKPETHGFEKYAFGWFWWEQEKGYMHFDLMREMYLGTQGLTAEQKAVFAEQQFEHSPMPQSGRSIGPEEDIATTMGWYQASEGTREYLKQKYPLRFKLLQDKYFGEWLPQKEMKRISSKL